ncbi:hypothetical protein RUND412_003268 [Rhizina undulata]
MAPTRRSTRKTADSDEPPTAEPALQTTRARSSAPKKTAARGKKVVDTVPEPAIEEIQEELEEEVMPATTGRGTKRKVAEKTAAPSKRSKRNAPVEPVDVDPMEVEQREEEPEKEQEEGPSVAPVPAKGRRGRFSASKPEVQIEIAQPAKNTRKQGSKDAAELEETELTQSQPTRATRGRKTAPKSTTEMTKATRPQPVNEPEAEEEPVLEVKPTRGRGRKAKEAVTEPEPEIAEPEAEKEPVPEVKPTRARGRKAKEVVTELGPEVAELETEEPPETTEVEPATKHRGHKPAPKPTPKLTRATRFTEQPAEAEQAEDTQEAVAEEAPEVQPTRATRGRKTAPKSTTEMTKATRSQPVNEPEAEEEPVPEVKPTRARGRKAKEAVTEPEPEVAEPEAETEPVSEVKPIRVRGRKAKEVVTELEPEVTEPVREEPPETTEVEPVTKRRGRKSAPKLTPKATRATRSIEQPVEVEQVEDTQEAVADESPEVQPTRATRDRKAAPKSAKETTKVTRSQPVNEPEAEEEPVPEIKPTRARGRKVKEVVTEPEAEEAPVSEVKPTRARGRKAKGVVAEPEPKVAEPEPEVTEPETEEPPETTEVEPVTKRRGRKSAPKLTPKATRATRSIEQPVEVEQAEDTQEAVAEEAPEVQPTRATRGRKEAPKSAEETTKATRSQPVNEPEAEEEPVPEIKPTRTRGRKAKEVVAEPEPEVDGPEREEPPETFKVEPATKRRGRKPVPKPTPKATRATRSAVAEGPEEVNVEIPTTDKKKDPMYKEVAREELFEPHEPAGQASSSIFEVVIKTPQKTIPEEAVAEEVVHEEEAETVIVPKSPTIVEEVPIEIPDAGVVIAEQSQAAEAVVEMEIDSVAALEPAAADIQMEEDEPAEVDAVANAPASTGSTAPLSEIEVDMENDRQVESAPAAPKVSGTSVPEQSAPHNGSWAVMSPIRRPSPAKTTAPVLSSPAPHATPKSSPTKRLLSPLIATPHNRFIPSNGSSPLQHSPVLPLSPFAARLIGGGESPVKSPVPVSSTAIKVLTPAASSLPSGGAANDSVVGSSEVVAAVDEDGVEGELVETSVPTKELEPMSSPVMMPPSTPLALSGRGMSPVKQSPVVASSPLVGMSELGSDSFLGLAGLKMAEGGSPSKRAVSFAASPLTASALYRSPTKGTSPGLGSSSRTGFRGSPLRREEEESEAEDDAGKGSPRKRHITADGSFSQWYGAEDDEDDGIPEDFIETAEKEVEEDKNKEKEVEEKQADERPESLEREATTVDDSSFNRWLEGESGYTDVEPTMNPDEERDEFPRYPMDDSLMLPEDLVNASGSGSQEAGLLLHEHMTLQLPNVIHATDESALIASTTEESGAGAAVISSRVSEFEYSVLEQVRPDVTGRTDSLENPQADNVTAADEDNIPDTSANFSMVSGISEFGEKEAEASTLPPAAEDAAEKGDSSEFVRTAASVVSSPSQGNRPASEVAVDEEVEAATGVIHQGVIIDPAFSLENVRTADSLVSSPPTKDESAPGEHPSTPLAANSSVGPGQVVSDPVEAPATPQKRRTAGLLSRTVGPERRQPMYEISPIRQYASSPVRNDLDTPMKPVKPFVLRKAVKEESNEEAGEDESDGDVAEILSDIDPDEHLLTPMDLLEDSGMSSPPSIWSSFDASFNRGLLLLEDEEAAEPVSEETKEEVTEEAIEDAEEDLLGAYDEDKGPAIEFGEYEIAGDDSFLEEIAPPAPGVQQESTSNEKTAESYGDDYDSAMSAEYRRQIDRPENPTPRKSLNFGMKPASDEDSTDFTGYPPDKTTPSKSLDSFGSFPSLAPPTNRGASVPDEWFSSPFQEEVQPASPAKRTGTPLRKQLFKSPAKGVHFNAEADTHWEFTAESGESSLSKALETSEHSTEEYEESLDSLTATNTEWNAFGPQGSPFKSVLFNPDVQLETFTVESGETSFTKAPETVEEDESTGVEEPALFGLETTDAPAGITTDQADASSNVAVPQALNALDPGRIPAHRRQTTGAIKSPAKKDTWFGRMGVSPGRALRKASKEPEDKPSDETTVVGNKRANEEMVGSSKRRKNDSHANTTDGDQTPQFVAPPELQEQLSESPGLRQPPLTNASTSKASKDISSTPTGTTFASKFATPLRTSSTTKKTLRPARRTPKEATPRVGSLKIEGIEEALQKYTPSNKRYLKWNPGATFYHPSDSTSAGAQKRRHTVDANSASGEQEAKRRKSSGDNIKQLGTVEDPFAFAPQSAAKLSIRQSYLLATPSARKAKAEVRRRRTSDKFGDPIEAAELPRRSQTPAKPPAALPASGEAVVSEALKVFQALARGWVARRKARQMLAVNKVILAQSLWRRRAARKEFVLTRAAAVIIQRAWRRRQDIIDELVRAGIQNSSPQKPVDAAPARTEDSPRMTSFFDDFLTRHEVNKKKKAVEVTPVQESTEEPELPAPKGSLLPVPARALAGPSVPAAKGPKSLMPVRRVHKAKSLLFPQYIEPSSSSAPNSSGPHSPTSTPEKRKAAEEEPSQRSSKRAQTGEKELAKAKDKPITSIPKPKRLPKAGTPAPVKKSFSLKPPASSSNTKFAFNTANNITRITRQNTLRNRWYYCDFEPEELARATPKPPSPDAKSQARAAAVARRKRANIEMETGVVLGPGDEDDFKPELLEGRRVKFVQGLEVEEEKSSPKVAKALNPQKGIMATRYEMDENGNVPGAEKRISDPEKLKDLMIVVKVSKYV